MVCVCVVVFVYVEKIINIKKIIKIYADDVDVSDSSHNVQVIAFIGLPVMSHDFPAISIRCCYMDIWSVGVVLSAQRGKVKLLPWFHDQWKP